MNALSPIISFRDVSKHYGPTKVFDHFCLDIAANEKVAVIGPSGSGKTSLLRILMTLETIDHGTVEVDGDALWRDVAGGNSVPAERSKLREIRAKIGMVFQAFNLFPHMTALRNIAEAPIAVLRMSKEEAYARARELLALVGLQGKENAYPMQLSGGQQQRVAIARALAMRPRIMLLDEVTSALDPELVGEVLNVIRRLAHEQDLTIVMVTHQMGFAREIADRVCFLEGGRVIEEGHPERLFSAPQNARTRAFLRAVLSV
jgi:polar amino acid transport system ATP-binding protein